MFEFEDELKERIAELEAENKKLRECLAWYADVGDCEKAANCGERPRKALGEVSGE